MANEIITGAEALMRALRAEEVNTIFGHPGGAIMPVFDSLYHYTRGENKYFNHILVRHKQAAAHAAQGYARVSGNVGVCLVTSGPLHSSVKAWNRVALIMSCSNFWRKPIFRPVEPCSVCRLCQVIIL